MKLTWQVLTYTVMTAVTIASKAAGKKGHPCFAWYEARDPPWPMSEENETVRRAVNPPRALLLVPPCFGLLLCSDRRHLKNNLMHGCFPPPPLSLSLFLSSVLAFLLSLSLTISLSLGRYHPWRCREEQEWMMERRLKVAKGFKEERAWVWDWNVKLKHKEHKSNTAHTDGTWQQF